VEAQARSLLSVEYFHVVFTLPPALHLFFLSERRKSYALLFEAALGALHAVCERRLGATPGTIAVLHGPRRSPLTHTSTASLRAVV
jgi:hypothetical protein